MLRKTDVLTLIAGLLVAVAIIGAGCTTTPGGNATTFPATPSVNATPAVTATVNLSGLTVRDELASRAASYAARLNGDTLSLARARGPASPEFRTIQSELKRMKAEDSRIAYVYTIEQRNGTARFVVDSEYGSSEGSARLGDTGIELPQQMPSAVNASGATDVYTDQWGTGFTGYAPIRDGTGAVVAVFRIDMGI